MKRRHRNFKKITNGNTGMKDTPVISQNNEISGISTPCSLQTRLESFYITSIINGEPLSYLSRVSRSTVPTYSYGAGNNNNNNNNNNDKITTHTPEWLSQIGFYYTPVSIKHSNTITCSCCLSRIIDPVPINIDIIKLHLKDSPDCCLSQIWNFRNLIIDTLNNNLSTWKNDKIFGINPNSETAKRIRLDTFKNWSFNKSKLNLMIESGLYYDPENEYILNDIKCGDDRVICMYCGLNLSQWEDSDDPVEVHKAQNPSCWIFNYNKQTDIRDNFNDFDNVPDFDFINPTIENENDIDNDDDDDDDIKTVESLTTTTTTTTALPIEILEQDEVEEYLSNPNLRSENNNTQIVEIPSMKSSDLSHFFTELDAESNNSEMLGASFFANNRQKREKEKEKEREREREKEIKMKTIEENDNEANSHNNNNENSLQNDGYANESLYNANSDVPEEINMDFNDDNAFENNQIFQQENQAKKDASTENQDLGKLGTTNQAFNDDKGEGDDAIQIYETKESTVVAACTNDLNNNKPTEKTENTQHEILLTQNKHTRISQVNDKVTDISSVQDKNHNKTQNSKTETETNVNKVEQLQNELQILKEQILILQQNQIQQTNSQNQNQINDVVSVTTVNDTYEHSNMNLIPGEVEKNVSLKIEEEQITDLQANTVKKISKKHKGKDKSKDKEKEKEKHGKKKRKRTSLNEDINGNGINDPLSLALSSKKKSKKKSKKRKIKKEFEGDFEPLNNIQVKKENEIGRDNNILPISSETVEKDSYINNELSQLKLLETPITNISDSPRANRKSGNSEIPTDIDKMENSEIDMKRNIDSKDQGNVISYKFIENDDNSEISPTLMRKKNKTPPISESKDEDRNKRIPQTLDEIINQEKENEDLELKFNEDVELKDKINEKLISESDIMIKNQSTPYSNKIKNLSHFNSKKRVTEEERKSKLELLFGSNFSKFDKQIGKEKMDDVKEFNANFSKTSNENIWIPIDTNKYHDIYNDIKEATGYIKEVLDSKYELLSEDLEGLLTEFVASIPPDQLKMTIKEWIVCQEEQAVELVLEKADEMEQELQKNQEEARQFIIDLPEE